ncbi:hypothetical protein PCCS19_07390 [Paenibacillus sp. CCS19]|uniref:hypothetical protein n=1 Tax=Paenibacillus sp. CCS19 TaxID=3158387 RepID=UPI00256D0B0A|nr:hypothetical protein [Paenibacillus cellulosilyticus]GMK37685.1 hypothetical protein PCCS19_07390 [Paenibacillus cellulosilyticus]
MEKIHLENVIKSFFLGLFLGVMLQLQTRSDVSVEYRVLQALASGSIGFIIGFITEWLTLKLPISMAKARAYFFINNLIALIVTTLIMGSFVLIVGYSKADRGQFMTVLLIVLGVVCIANFFDYMMYRRAQRKLASFKALIKDK